MYVGHVCLLRVELYLQKYLDWLPPGNHGCCWYFAFGAFFLQMISNCLDWFALSWSFTSLSVFPIVLLTSRICVEAYFVDASLASRLHQCVSTETPQRFLLVFSCQRPYHVEHTGSRPITEVKQRRARLVLGWVTAWEPRVLLIFCFWRAFFGLYFNLSWLLCPDLVF